MSETESLVIIIMVNVKEWTNYCSSSKAIDEEAIQRKLVEFRNALQNKEAITEFDDEVFETVIDKVIVGERKGEGFDPYSVTYVFNAARNESEGTKIIEIAEFDCGYNYWTFTFDPSNNTRYRTVCDSFTVKIALKVE